MHKKSFTFGMGVGILLITALFFFIYKYQKNILTANTTEPVAQISEQEIIDQAKKLGMAFYISQPQEPNEDLLNNQQIIDKAMEFGMVFPKMYEDNDDQPEDPEQEYGEYENYPDAQVENTVYDEEVIEEVILETEGIPGGAIEVSDSGEGYVTIFIPQGAIARNVANMLAENGIVDDTESFVNFMVENNSTKKIDHGTYEIPYGSSYEEILKIIKN